ncbi:MAG: serine/threonine protein kinase [Phycisphaerales bacterium]|nr:serine/threonine protein kinase [Phycisphaerales bacterium]
MSGVLEEDDLLRSVPRLCGYPVLDPCVMYDFIGGGGMAAVYRAHHLNLEVEVAVKCLKAASDHPSALARFQDEAKVAARIKSPNLIGVYDVRHAHNLNYIVMELVDGESVAERIRRKSRLSAPEALAITIQATRGLAAAHAKEVIHRDVKPGNVLVSSTGEVKLADLGIARSARTGDTLVTDARLIIGTPQYMPPEQFRGATRVSKQSDIYSMGATLWYQLTGVDPFSGLDFDGVEDAVMNQGLPDPRATVQDAPARVAEIIRVATQREAGARYPNADAFVEAMSAALAELGGAPALIDPKAGATRHARLSPPTREVTKEIRTKLASGTKLPPTMVQGTRSADGPGAVPAIQPAQRASLGAKVGAVAASVLLVSAGVVIAMNVTKGPTPAPGPGPSPTPDGGDARIKDAEARLAAAIKGAKLDEAILTLGELRGLPGVRATDLAAAEASVLGAVSKAAEGHAAESRWDEAFALLSRASTQGGMTPEDLKPVKDRVFEAYQKGVAGRLDAALGSNDWKACEEMLAGLRRENRLTEGEIASLARRYKDALLGFVSTRLDAAEGQDNQAQASALMALVDASPEFSDAEKQRFASERAQIRRRIRADRAVERKDPAALKAAIDDMQGAGELVGPYLAQLRDLREAIIAEAIETAKRTGDFGTARLVQIEQCILLGLPMEETARRSAALDELYLADRQERINLHLRGKAWPEALGLLAELAATKRFASEAYVDKVRDAVDGFRGSVATMSPIFRTGPLDLSGVRESLTTLSDVSPDAAMLLADGLTWYRDTGAMLAYQPGEGEFIIGQLRRASAAHPRAYFAMGDYAARNAIDKIDSKLEGRIVRGLTAYGDGARLGDGDCLARLGQFASAVQLDPSVSDVLPASVIDRIKELGDPLELFTKAVDTGTPLAEYLYADYVSKAPNSVRGPAGSPVRARALECAQRSLSRGFPDCHEIITVLGQ